MAYSLEQNPQRIYVNKYLLWRQDDTTHWSCPGHSRIAVLDKWYWGDISQRYMQSLQFIYANNLQVILEDNYIESYFSFNNYSTKLVNLGTECGTLKYSSFV